MAVNKADKNLCPRGACIVIKFEKKWIGSGINSQSKFCLGWRKRKLFGTKKTYRCEFIWEGGRNPHQVCRNVGTLWSQNWSA